MREKGGRGKEGEENGREWGKGTEEGKTEERRELRKTPEGKRGGMGKTEKKNGEGEKREGGGGNSFLRGVNKKPKNALFP